MIFGIDVTKLMLWALMIVFTFIHVNIQFKEQRLREKREKVLDEILKVLQKGKINKVD